MQYSGAGKKLIHQKNQKQKISWHCPFKLSQVRAQLSVSNAVWSYDALEIHVMTLYANSPE
jgi:hypothetical protein